MSPTPLLVVLAIGCGTIGLGSVYFRRWPVSPPPASVFNLGDVGFLLGVVVVLPLLYLMLPSWLLVGLMALGALSAAYVVAKPVSGR
jgi:hypothetical protein